MAEFRRPGVLCALLNAFGIDGGTLCRAATKPPGTVGTPRPAPKPADPPPPKKEKPVDPKKDASTDIESRVTDFAADVTEQARSLPTAPDVTFRLSRNPVGGFRTPEQQAIEVSEGDSQVCWSAHMADKARHVNMLVDGKVHWKPAQLFGTDFEAFKLRWGEAMKRHGLKNYKGEDGWGAGDEFHLELEDSKMGKSDPRAQACLAEYARLTRKEAKPKNSKFEKSQAELLKPHLEKYEKPAPPKP